MTPERETTVDDYEKMSPIAKNSALRVMLSKLPHFLTLDETSLVANMTYLNNLHNLLQYFKGTKTTSRYILYEAALAREHGVEALRQKAEEKEERAIESFPEMLFVDLDPEGGFGDKSAQKIDQRVVKKLAARVGNHRSIAKDHSLYVEAQEEYVETYKQNPFDTIAKRGVSDELNGSTINQRFRGQI